MTRRTATYSNRMFRAAMLLVLLVAIIAAVAQSASAGPVTNPTTPPSSPFVKLGVYQGVISIVPDNLAALEIGNAGTDIAATGKISLLPGGLSDPNGITIGKSNAFGQLEAAVFANNGRVCLNTNGAGTAWQCVSSWAASSSGDTFWDQTDTVLAPLANTADQIRVGTAAKPVTAGYGHPLDVYAASAAPALYTTGQLRAGDQLDAGSGNVHVAGQVRLPYDTVFPTKLTMFGTSTGPWTGANVFSDEAVVPLSVPPIFNPTGIDADTFDSAAVLLFPSDNNLFWRSTPGGPALCLATTASKLCTGGTNAGADCSDNAAVCQDGGNCTNMCNLAPASCPASVSNGYRCVDGAGADIVPRLSCTPGGSECGADVCAAGAVRFVGSSPSSACTGIASCDEFCRTGSVTICDGSNTALCPAAYGDKVVADAGSELACAHPLGNNSTYQRVCDCRLSTATPYYGVSNSGAAHICTPVFQ